MAKKNLSYTEAIQEIESILQQLEEGEMDVDILAEKVKRSTELIRLCKLKLQKTEEEVNKILEEDQDQ